MKQTKVTADVVVIEDGKVLLIKRGIEPFKDMWALPGGHVEYNESVEDAAIREAKEETGFDVSDLRLLGVYSKPGRDPRGHTITIAYLCKAKSGAAKAGDDAEEAWWWLLDDLPKLAFDHSDIIKDALNER